ncbi:MAG: hypothetical protein ACW964_18220, partial [Candidatus Hodarchaeales archaeon]
MNRKRIQLFAVSMAFVALMFMSQSGIINALPTAPNKIFADTLVGSDDFFSEGLELVAAEGSGMIAQYYQWDGQKTFPLNPSALAFEKLEVLYIISS